MDLRIVKTKMMLKNALVEIASEKPFNKITVTELTQKAMINKATFYLHYKNIYDLINEVEEEMIGEFVKAVGKVDSFFRNVDNFFEIMVKTYFENEKLMKILNMNNRTIELQDKIVTTLRNKIIEENPHVNFDEELRVLITLSLRGVVDLRLYREFPDYVAVQNYLKEYIRVLTDYYREKSRKGHGRYTQGYMEMEEVEEDIKVVIED